MAMATGDYLTFVDSDDWIERDMYEVMLSALLDTDSEMAICRYKSVRSERIEDASTGDAVLFEGSELQEAYIRQPDGSCQIAHAAWNKLYKRALAQDLAFPAGICEDILFTTRLLLRVKRCVYLNTAYYNYVADRPGSIMNSESFVRFVDSDVERSQKKSLVLRQNGRAGLADVVDAMFYVRLSHYYLEAEENKISEPELSAFRNRLGKLFWDNKKSVCALYRLPAAGFKETVRMRLFLFSPRVFLTLSKIRRRFKMIVFKRSGKG